MQQHGCGLTATTPHLHCRVFEDNSGAVELASSVKNPKMRPRTRHINTKYHHFRSKVQDGTISIHQVSTEEMLADILTKVCNEEIHTKLRKQLMGWWSRGLRRTSEGVKQKLLCCRLPSWQYSKSPNRPSVNQSFRGSRFGSHWVPVRFASRSPSHNCFASLFLGHCRMFCGQMLGSAIVSRAPTRTQIKASSNLHITRYIFGMHSHGSSSDRYMFYIQSTQLHLKNNKRTKKDVKRTRRTALIRWFSFHSVAYFYMSYN